MTGSFTTLAGAEGVFGSGAVTGFLIVVRVLAAAISLTGRTTWAVVFGARQSLHRRRARVLLPPQALHLQTPVAAIGAFAAGAGPTAFDAAAALPARARVSRTGLPDTPMLNVLALRASVDGASVEAAVAVAQVAVAASASLAGTEATALMEPLPNVSELIAAALEAALAFSAPEPSTTAPGVAPSVDALAETRSPTTSPFVKLSAAAAVTAGRLHSSSSPSGSDWLSATQSLVGVSWKSFFCGFGSAGSGAASTWCTGIVSVVLGTSDIVFRRFADDSARRLLDFSMDTGVRIVSRSSFFFAPAVAVAGVTVVLSATA